MSLKVADLLNEDLLLICLQSVSFSKYLMKRKRKNWKTKDKGCWGNKTFFTQNGTEFSSFFSYTKIVCILYLKLFKSNGGVTQWQLWVCLDYRHMWASSWASRKGQRSTSGFKISPERHVWPFTVVVHWLTNSLAVMVCDQNIILK